MVVTGLRYHRNSKSWEIGFGAAPSAISRIETRVLMYSAGYADHAIRSETPSWPFVNGWPNAKSGGDKSKNSKAKKKSRLVFDITGINLLFVGRF